MRVVRLGKNCQTRAGFWKHLKRGFNFGCESTGQDSSLFFSLQIVVYLTGRCQILLTKEEIWGIDILTEGFSVNGTNWLQTFQTDFVKLITFKWQGLIYSNESQQTVNHTQNVFQSPWCEQQKVQEKNEPMQNGLMLPSATVWKKCKFAIDHLLSLQCLSEELGKAQLVRWHLLHFL